MPKTIYYQVPRLGKLTAELYTNSEKAFEILGRSNNLNHIERMKKTPQLGVIKNVYEGVHHTRWEYIATQLFIITRLKNNKGLGLSNNSPEIKENKVSGADILQVWVLLLNIGHLFGTFASERALLSQINNVGLKKVFKTGLPKDKAIYKRLKNLLDQEDIYRFHELISLFFLQRLKRKNPKDVDILIEILKYYRHDPPTGVERIRKLRRLSKRIRQVSYLFLDSHYGPVPLSFELGHILFNFEEYITDLFLADDSSIIKALNSFQSLLEESLYLSPKSVDAFGYHSKKVEDLLKSKKHSFSLKFLDNFLFNLENHFFNSPVQ